MDRRVARTRRALFDALIALIGRKDYGRIKVQDILDEADIGRSTFYAHFTSKDHLLECSLERLKAELAEARAASAADPDRSQFPSRTLFEHVARYAGVRTRLATGRGGAIVNAAVDDVLTDLLRSWLPTEMPDGLSRELVVRFIVSTFGATMDWWSRYRKDATPAEMDEVFRRLVGRGIPAVAYESFTGPLPGDRTA